MRVLQVHNRYRQFGGEDVVVARDAAILRRVGHEVERFDVSNPAGALAASGRLLASPWNPATYVHLRSAIERYRPDVAHVHNTWFSVTASAISALAHAGIPIVMTLHNYRLMCGNGLLLRDGKPCTVCIGRSPLPGVRYRCYNDSFLASAAAAASIWLSRTVDIWENVNVFIAMSDFAHQLFVEGGIDPLRIVVRPNFATDPGHRVGPPSTSDTVLYAGRLAPEKGVELVTRAWDSMDTGSLRLRILGDGPLRDALPRRYPTVEFVGSVSTPEVIGEMLAGRALLFPSLAYEGANPLSIVEAFSAGLPVLGSDLGAMREMLSPLGDRWLLHAGDIESWRTGMHVLHDSPSVDQAGRIARATYDARYTEATALDSIETVYRRALGDE